ncbi:MAG: ABC transporter permease [Flavobacteriales bacterium]|nr:ABC transporter permease [Flavobacteriales bacterium]
MSKIGLIIKREYTSRVRKKSFIVMTLLGPLLIVGFYALAGYIGMSDPGKMKVLILDDTKVCNSEDFSKSYDFEFQMYEGNVDELQEAVKEKSELPLVGLHLTTQTINGDASIYYDTPLSVSKESELISLVTQFTQKLRLKQAEITDEQYDYISVNMRVISTDVNTGETGLGAKAGIGFVFALVIYMFIFMYGVMVMRGVIEEKTNRIVEIMVSSVRPFQLMMGKIVGIALVGLTQFFVWVLLSTVLMAVVSSAIMPDVFDATNVTGGSEQLISEQLKPAMESGQNQEMNKILTELINAPWALLLGLFLFYFLGGYLLYASLFAAVGSAVDNETETQQFMLPITLPLIFGFMVSMMAVFNPGGSAIVWLSYIPFTSPVAMLVRVSIGDYAWWEVVISMVTLVITFILTTRLAAKIYRTGILMYGKKVTYRELFKWLKYK